MKTSNRPFVLSAVAMAFGLAVIAAPARATECATSCGETGAAPAAIAAQEGALAQAVAGDPAAKSVLKEPVPDVLANYGKITDALAADTLAGVPAAAQAIADLVANDASKTLPPEVATHAGALAKAQDLKAARESFKPLSAALIGYLDQAKVQTGTYHEMHCGMAKASWLQTSKDIKNPYYGASMLECGEAKRTF